MKNTRFQFKPKAEQTFQDVLGNELYFKDLENGHSPSEGDEVTIDGSPAEGEFIMPGGEKLVIEEGIVVKIFEPIEELQNRIKNKKNKSRFKFQSTL